MVPTRATALAALATLTLAGCPGEDGDAPRVSLALMDGGLLDATPSAPERDATSCVDSTGNEDFDDDGFSRAEGDCNDCELAVGPGAIDVPMNGIDEDCSGADAPASAASCDAKLDPASTKLEAVTQALGFCMDEVRQTSHRSGLIDARWLTLSGQEKLHDPRQVWLPTQFGTVAPHEGGALLVLSSGVARDATAPDYTRECDVFSSKQQTDSLSGWAGGEPPPMGFPEDSTACKSQHVSRDALAFDDVGLELTFRAPGNATGLAFDSMFFTYEYPDYVCSRFNDFFVALMDPAPTSALHDNVAMDDEGNPIGVNTGLLSVCTHTTRAARPIACEAGPALLSGTGYGRGESDCAQPPQSSMQLGGASTGWLHTEVPVRPGAVFTLRFVLWDSGDPLLDSTVLLDALHFIATQPVLGTKPYQPASSL